MAPETPISGNPFDPGTDPQRHETWEKTTRANAEKTDADRRLELQSAQLEDAGLHPQGVPVGSAGPVSVADGIGDTTTTRATPRRADRDAELTPAEEFRLIQAGKDPSVETRTVAPNVEGQIRPSGGLATSGDGTEEVIETPTTSPFFPPAPPDPHGAFPRPGVDTDAPVVEPVNVPEQPVEPSFAPDPAVQVAPEEPRDADEPH